jgi:hypothetical protein
MMKPYSRTGKNELARTFISVIGKVISY